MWPRTEIEQLFNWYVNDVTHMRANDEDYYIKPSEQPMLFKILLGKHVCGFFITEGIDITRPFSFKDIREFRLEHLRRIIERENLRHGVVYIL